MDESEKGRSNYSNHNSIVLDSCGEYRIQLAKVAHNTALCVIRGRNCFSFLGGGEVES